MESGPSIFGPPTTTNTGGNGQYNNKQNHQQNCIIKRSRATDMIFYWVRDRVRKKHYHIFWEEEKKNLSDYVTKYHPKWHHRTMRPSYVKAIKKT